MKTFTYKVNILDIVRYDMPKTFDPTSLNELDFVKLLKCEAYDNEISENIHRTHITLDEFGEVPMYQFFLDDNEIEKNHVAPPSSQDEALSRYSVSGEVPR